MRKLNNFICKKLFSCINYFQLLVSNKITNGRLNYSQDISWHRSLSIPPEKIMKPLDLWCIPMYSRKYRKRLVPWNGLKIFLTNMSAQCWYSCLFHKRACFLAVDLQWFFQCTQEVSNFNVFWFKLISRNTSQRRWDILLLLH